MADDGDWVIETINDPVGFRTALWANGGLRTVPSSQELGVFENPTFGRVMILDGAYQLTTGDEFIYHEMMTHIPLFAHGAAREVLVIGGGDGGVAREVLRHPVERLVMVEIDAAVVQLAKELFPQVSAGAFDDPRFELVIADGARFVEDGENRFDVVIVDSPDPEGEGAALFTPAFYAGCRRLLRPGGVMVTQSGMPFLRPDWLAQHARQLRSAFEDVGFFLSTVPSYTGGPMAHGFASDDADLRKTPAETIEARYDALGRFPTRYWTPRLHAASFALPAYVEAAVGPNR
jgi:spermidine synthase